MKKKATKKKSPEPQAGPRYRVPEKYRETPIRVRLDGKWVALGRNVVIKGRPPQIDVMIKEATDEQYLKLAEAGRYGIELIQV